MTAPTNIKFLPSKKKTDLDNAGQMFDNTELHVSENNLFNLTLDAIKNANNSSETDHKRAKRLSDVLTEFQNISNMPANTPEQIAVKSRMLHKLMVKNKDIFYATSAK